MRKRNRVGVNAALRALREIATLYTGAGYSYQDLCRVKGIARHTLSRFGIVPGFKSHPEPK